MKQVRAAVVVLLVALGITFTAVTPAHAAYTDCPLNFVCLFLNRDGGGGYIVNIYQAPGTCYNVPSSANDRATSYVNRLSSTRSMQVYRNANCSGHALHKDNGFGGSTQPFPSSNAPYPTNVNGSGNFINIDNLVLPGCSLPDHCDNDIATSIWFNNV